MQRFPNFSFFPRKTCDISLKVERKPLARRPGAAPAPPLPETHCGSLARFLPLGLSLAICET